MTFENIIRLIALSLFSLYSFSPLLLFHNDVTHVHIGRLRQQSGAEDDHLAFRQLDEMREGCGDAAGTGVVEQGVDRTAKGVVAVV